MILPAHLPWPLIWSDSEVSRIFPGNEASTSPWKIQLSVAQVRHPVLKEQGYARGVVITLQGVTHAQADEDGMGRLAWARLIDPTGSGSSPIGVTLPGAITGSLRLEATFANGSTLQLDAQRLLCDWVAEPNFQPSLAC